MKKWLRRMLGVAAFCGLAAGCKQQMFLHPQCFELAQETLPARAESDFHYGDSPLHGGVKSPATLKDPDRPARNLTLREAFALALENGSVSDFGGGANAGGGQVNDTQLSFQGGSPNGQIDRVKALALAPALAGANVEASIARFDAQWVSSMNWATTDNLPQGLAGFQNGSNAALATGLVKPLPSGGFAATSFSTNYRYLSDPPGTVVNPLYDARVNMGLEIPLLRDYGVELNQLLSRGGSYNGTGFAGAAGAVNNRSLAGNVAGVGNEGILISRIRVDQQRAEFERRVQSMLLNVEVAYWKLYQAYGRLYSFEEVMRIAHKSWLTNQAKFVAGTIGPANYHPIRGQYEEFRGERMAALGEVLERERNLRGILGLPPEDGTRLVPIDSPVLAPFQPNWDASLDMALHQKPELSIARDYLRTAQYQLVAQKNYLKPDLRFVANYSPVGSGPRLDGNGAFDSGDGVNRPSNALRSLSSGHFNDWQIGLTMSMPLGFRLENAAVRVARLNLAQTLYVLKDQEDKTTRVLAQQYQKVQEWYSLIESRRAERKAYAESVDARYREFAVGRAAVSDYLLEAQRRLASAQVKEYEAIAEYNAALARFEWAKGNLLRHNNIVIAEGAIPECAQVSACEHERQRAQACVLRERPSPLQHPGRMACDAGLPGQLLPSSEAPPMIDTTHVVHPQLLGKQVAPAAAPAPGLERVDQTPTFRSVPRGAQPTFGMPTPAAPPAAPAGVQFGAPQPADTSYSATTPGFALPPPTVPAIRVAPTR